MTPQSEYSAENNGAQSLKKLSIVIPTLDEDATIEETIVKLISALDQAAIEHEIIVINDNSTDDTEQQLVKLAELYPTLRYINNPPPNGFGLALLAGLNEFTGDAVVIVMADGSDDPADVVKYWRKLEEGYDCVFGSRFMSGAKVVDYPFHKLILNRLANTFILILFRFQYNDVTNAFKCFRRHVIDGVRPLLSHHFNLTVELPLKAIIRGYSYTVVPTNWYNRKSGVSKLRIREMGSRYLFIVLYCLVERLFSRGDYHRDDQPAPTSPRGSVERHLPPQQ